MAASFTQDQGFSPANPQDWNEEEGKVVINTRQVGLSQAAVGTNPRLALKSLLSWANAADENHLVRSSCPGSVIKA
jgi:hypothetical protein